MIEETAPQTIAAYFVRTVAARPTVSALGYIHAGELHWLTWQEVHDRAHELAVMLRISGIAPGDRVAHVSENRYEWIVTDLALHLAAAVHVPIHVTLSGDQIAEQISDSGAKHVFVSSKDLLAKFANQLPPDLTIRLYDDDAHHAASRTIVGRFDNFPVPRIPHPASSALATILYTSGTTGRPRGVMLSHHNLASNAAAVCEAHCVDSNHTMLCILPLSHIYARTCDLYTWICSGSKLVLAESRETLLRDCEVVHPTALNAVPFVYQRVMDGLRSNSATSAQSALRTTFGGQIKQLFCGGAPAAPEVETWYAENGLPLLPGYGLTEASPVIAVSTTQACRPGSVGKALPGVEVRIAADGELLTRGPHVMLGYWQNEAATAEAIRDGWLHTGDLAELAADGFIYIRGRKKELIVLSTGKKVSPTRVESLLTSSALIDQAAVFGDGQCGLIALIVPSACGLSGSEDRGARSESIQVEINRCLDRAAHEEQIHRFALLDRPFSIERGELTAKMSLCRTVIARNFAAELESISPQSTQSSQRKRMQSST